MHLLFWGWITYGVYHDVYASTGLDNGLASNRQQAIIWTNDDIVYYYNMTVWILAANYISFTIAAGLIRLHMPGVKKSRV